MRSVSASIGAAALTLAAIACSGDHTALAPVVGPPMVDPTIVSGIVGLPPTQQLANMGSAIDPGPKVLVYDLNSRPMPGVRVSFQVTEGGGAVDPAETITSASGVAAVNVWKLGSKTGANTLIARVGSASTTFTVFGIDPAEQPIAHFRLAQVDNRPAPYSSGYNDLGAVLGLEGNIDLYSNYFIRTFKFTWAYGNNAPVLVYAQGPYSKSESGNFQFGYVNVSGMLRGDSLYLAPEKLPDDLILSTVYLKQ